MLERGAMLNNSKNDKSDAVSQKIYSRKWRFFVAVELSGFPDTNRIFMLSG